MTDPATPTPDPAPSPGKRVLLVEDNEAASKGLARLLESQGYQVALAQTGAAALELLKHDPAPDIVVTDIQLPDLDGREIARVALELHPRPSVGAITGWDIEEGDGYRSRWGFDWVLIKPLNVQEFLRRLREPAAGSGPTVPSPRVGGQEDLERPGVVG